MKKNCKYFLLLAVILLIVSCDKKDTAKVGNDTILEGKVSIIVDETLLPIIEDEQMIFESKYKAKLNLIAQSEKEAVLSLVNNKASIIVLSRNLTIEEEKIFKNKNIIPKQSTFAIDALAFIKNKNSTDTIISLEDVLDFMKGEKNGIKGLVFDNPNSSSVRYLNKLAGINSIPENGVFSFKTNDEVIDYVSKNDGMIGIVGMNWLSQPTPKMQSSVNNLNILSVKGAGNEYVYPSQENIATKKYPLARELYIINCQGYEGLGMGFASFVGGQIGQRIILKSGLAPVRVPSRKIVTRTQLEKK